jgi:hypothetical protein
MTFDYLFDQTARLWDNAKGNNSSDVQIESLKRTSIWGVRQSNTTLKGSIHSMFCCRVRRPPTVSWSSANNSMNETRHYLFNPTDPRAVCLEKGLSQVNEAARLWKQAKCNSTSSSTMVYVNRNTCASLKRILMWLIQESDQEMDQIREDYLHVRHFFARSDFDVRSPLYPSPD